MMLLVKANRSIILGAMLDLLEIILSNKEVVRMITMIYKKVIAFSTLDNKVVCLLYQDLREDMDQ
jgi:hypothetical protein